MVLRQLNGGSERTPSALVRLALSHNVLVRCTTNSPAPVAELGLVPQAVGTAGAGATRRKNHTNAAKLRRELEGRYEHE